MKVNYMIAACSARSDKIDSTGESGVDTLKKHLRELAKTNLDALSQITIIRTLPLERNVMSAPYWDIAAEIQNLKCSVVFFNTEDRYWSYSSWIRAIQHYRDQFDYYILMEDDYYPAIPNFVDELIRIHQEKLPDGGYLCSFATDIAAVSNGIVDTATALANLDSRANPVEDLAPGAQTLFSEIVASGQLADYTDQYRTLFWGGAGQVKQSHNPTTDLIRPIQYLKLGEVIY